MFSRTYLWCQDVDFADGRQGRIAVTANMQVASFVCLILEAKDTVYSERYGARTRLTHMSKLGQHLDGRVTSFDVVMSAEEVTMASRAGASPASATSGTCTGSGTFSTKSS